MSSAADEVFRQELRISTAGLEPGMFVTQLDRPWLGTGFPLEGISVSTEADVQKLRTMCRFVRVDLARGRAPDLRFVVLDGEVEAPPAPPPPPPPPRPMSPAASIATHAFGQDFAHAQQALDRLQSDVRDAMEGLRSSGRLDAQKLQQGVDAMLDSITRNPAALPWVMEMRRKGDYIYQHGLACSIWAATFGRHLGFEREELRDLALGALLCDVGKIRLAADLLAKTTPLSGDELGHVREHVAESLRIVRDTPGLSPVVATIVAAHHERHDGSGYPNALKGAQIPMFARIAGLVDSYDAMISTRAYAPSRSPHQAVMELYHARDRLFQAELVEQFIRTCGVYPTGTLVELTDGTVGVVMSVNTLKRLRPCVMLLLGPDKLPLPEFRLLDLTEVTTAADGSPLNVKGGLPHGAFGIDRASLFLD